MTLANKVKEFNEEIVPVARQIVHGDADTVVATDGGPVRSFAKLQKDIEASAAKSVADYAALRTYTGNEKHLYVTGYLATAKPSGIAGVFVRDDSDTTSADNGGTVIVSANGKRWKRTYSGGVNVNWFGARGIANAAPAFHAALAAANGVAPVDCPDALYTFTETLNAVIAGTTLRGGVNGFTYGVGPKGTIFRFANAGVAVNTYANPGDEANIAYITLENLIIDGNNMAAVGFDGGFVSTLTNVASVRCTVAGLRLSTLSQSSKYTNCAFNGNLDGVLSRADLTSQSFINCVFRQNTRYGVNGPFNSSNFHNATFESNGGSGVNLTSGGAPSFTGKCYFEQNDTALGVDGYHVRINTPIALEATSFENVIFGSTTVTKIAKIDAGKVEFSHCQHTGSKLTPQITASDSADVTIYKSFSQYPMPANVKIVPEVVVDQASAALLDGVSDRIVTNSPAVILGPGDFSVNAVFEVDSSATTLRNLCSGNAGALCIGLNGSAAGVTGVNFAKYGSAIFHTSPVTLRHNSPVHLVYTRTGGVGRLYINGVLIDTFADTNDYSITQATIGSDQSTQGLRGKLYAFSYFALALTAQQVFDLWRCGGNARAAKLTGITLDLHFDIRPAGQIFNSAASKWLPFNGAAGWASPDVSNLVATGVAKPVGVGQVSFGSTTTVNVNAAGGAAAALPAKPEGYLIFSLGSSLKLIPFYNP